MTVIMADENPAKKARTSFGDLKPLEGKVALVTGGSEGIGSGICIALARAGAHVCINFCSKITTNAETVATQCREFGVKAILAEANVADKEAVEAMFRQVKAELGAVDIVVTNAITSKRNNILETKFEDFKNVIEVGVYGTFHCLQNGAKQMLDAGKKGNFIHIGSPHVNYSPKDCIDYNTAKAGSQHLFMSAANELMWKGIRCNVVEPGWTYTPGEVRLYGEEALAKNGASMPFGRLAMPQDISSAVVWLCSDEAKYITGANLKVDGGAFIESAPSWEKPPRDRV